MVAPIPLFKVYWDEDDINSVEKIIRSGMQWCIGPQVQQFEDEIARYLNVKHCITFNSGGSALHALMTASGIEPGDEVIVPSFTFIATAYAPLYVGAKPIFGDIESERMGLDPTDIRKRIGKRTKAIIPIHYGGLPCRIEELREICDERSIMLLEDAAESFGAKTNGNMVGTIGDASIFSFCQNKIFSTGEGGCVVTNNDEIYERLKLVQSYGRKMNGEYFSSNGPLDYVKVGYNWRMSSIEAALGLSQLRKVDRLIELRRDVAKRMREALQDIHQIELPAEPAEIYQVYQMFTILVKPGRQVRDDLSKYLSERGIASKVYFDPVHDYTVFRQMGLESVELLATRDISSRVLSLPMYPGMTDEDVETIANAIRAFFTGAINVR